MSEHVTLLVRDGQLLLAGEPVFAGDGEALIEAVDVAARTERPELLITPNVDQVLELSTNSEFRRVFSSASIRVLDGMPLVAFARLRGAKHVERHTGADLLPAVAGQASSRGWKVVITGGDPRSSEAAARSLSDANPGADVRAVAFPMISSIDDPASQSVIEQLRAVGPDIVFLCLGAPKQELWFAHWQDLLPPALYVGAGAAVDFAAGTAKRAPTWAQRAGLEWVWRLVGEPKRLAARYLVRGPRILAVFARSLRAAD